MNKSQTYLLKKFMAKALKECTNQSQTDEILKMKEQAERGELHFYVTCLPGLEIAYEDTETMNFEINRFVHNVFQSSEFAAQNNDVPELVKSKAAPSTDEGSVNVVANDDTFIVSYDETKEPQIERHQSKLKQGVILKGLV